MMSESKKNQFWRWGVAGVLVAAAAVWYFNSSYVGTGEAEHTVSEKLRTEERAKQVAQSLIEKKFELTSFVTVSQKRNVASENAPVEAVTQKVSEGQYGRDAWGHPFFFKVVAGKVVIWSKGENHQLDSSEDQILSNNAAGDDIVVSVAL